MNNMQIRATSIQEMTEIVYELVTRGLTFEVENAGGDWVINLLGGY